MLRPGDSWGDLGQPQHLVLRARLLPPVRKAIDGDTTQLDDGRSRPRTTRSTNGAQRTPTATPDNGLVPAWCDGEAQRRRTGNQRASTTSTTRAGRRSASAWTGAGTARRGRADYVSKTSNFFSGIGAAEHRRRLRAERQGARQVPTARAAHAGQQSAAFIGPAAVGAMSDRQIPDRSSTRPTPPSSRGR